MRAGIRSFVHFFSYGRSKDSILNEGQWDRSEDKYRMSELQESLHSKANGLCLCMPLHAMWYGIWGLGTCQRGTTE